MSVNMSSKKQPFNTLFINITKNVNDHCEVRIKKIHEIL